MPSQTTDRPILVVAGARPNFMKVVPILHELDRRGVRRMFVHTGQHYDIRMSEALLTDLSAPPPDVLLDVGSATHAVQTARVMERFEPVVLESKPSWIVVVGDVNSTLACALVASKLRGEVGCRIAHIEAGLRSGDWEMPEEINRVLTDRLSDLLLTPSEDAHENLRREGIPAVAMRFVGNVMIDSLLSVLPLARVLPFPAQGVQRERPYVLATLHRPSNVDDQARLTCLLEALARIAADLPVVFPMHPRTVNRVRSAGLDRLVERIAITPPLGYAEMVNVLDGAAVVVTDSGGLQEESTVLGVPCVTVRAQTERPVTVTHGTNRMVEWPPTIDGVTAAVNAAICRGRVPIGSVAPPGWDGHAAPRIVDALFADALRT